MGKKKTANFTEEGIESLEKNKPVVYKIENKKGDLLYAGVAKRGRVEERLKEHLPGEPDAIRGGAKVRIIPKNNINEARETESRIIEKQKPLRNKKGK